MVAEVAVKSDLVLGPDRLVDDIGALFQRFEDLFERGSAVLDLPVAGCRFQVRTEIASYVRFAERAIFASGPAGAGIVRIAIGVAGRGDWPVLRWAASHYNEREIESVLAPSRYRLHFMPDIGFWQLFDRATARGFQIMAAPDGFPKWDPGSPLRNLIQWHLGQTGGALLHAGSLGIDGKGVLLAGAGGSGKSGTVLSGILHGLETVGDDYVFVRRGPLTAHPVFETLKQDPAGIRRLGLGQHPAVPQDMNWQGKYQLFLRELRPAARTEALSLKALLLPAVSGKDRTSVRPVSARDAFLALAPSGVSQIPGDRSLLYATAADVARGLPCYRLDLGPDPAEVAATLLEFIMGQQP